MSRFYEMEITIKNFKNKRLTEIKKAAKKEWTLENFAVENKTLFASGTSWLCCGESEEEFSERLAKAIFKANQGPCSIEVGATYLENLPFEVHSFGQQEYKELMGQAREEKT